MNSKLAKYGISVLLAAAAVFSSPANAYLPEMSVTVSAASKLAAPANIKTESGSDRITLTWSAVKGADAYRVYLYNKESGKYETYGNVTKTKCTVKKLEKNTTYRLKVAALVEKNGKYSAQTKSDAVKAKTTSGSSVPAAPSGDYTGFATAGGKKYYYENGKAAVSKTALIDGRIYLFGDDGALVTSGVHTVNGKKYYSDDEGVVTCNDWITLKNSKYYYADKAGRLTEYSFAETWKNSGVRLFINGTAAKANDTPYKDNKMRNAYYRLGNDYYKLYLLSTGVSVAKGDNMMYQEAPVYDLATGKQIGIFSGYPEADESGYISGGKVFNSMDGTVWSFIGKNKAPKVSKAGSLVIIRKNVYRNHSDSIDLTLEVCNNTDKTIKSVIFTVYGVDKSGNKVRYDPNREYNMYLQDGNSVTNGKRSTKEWWSIMSTPAIEDIIISGAEITFSDGTKTTLDADGISQIY